MRYLGGKTRIAKQIAAEVNKVRRPGQWCWDAFCGGLSVSVALAEHGPVWSTDACAPLIHLYQAVQAGWDPPTEVSKETYQAARSLPDTDPMKAFCGFGCSFGGKWFGGYAKGFNGTLTYPQLAARNVKLNAVRVQSAIVDFLAVQPQSVDGVLYLDPPYAGTTGYAGVPPFDHARFVQRVHGWSAFADVFVSEYAFPLGVCVFERSSKTKLNVQSGSAKDATERLFHIAKGSL